MLSCFTVNTDNCSMRHYLEVQQGLEIRLVRYLQGGQAGLILGPEALQEYPPVLVRLEIPVFRDIPVLREYQTVL